MTQKQTDITDTESHTSIDVLHSLLEEETAAAKEAETKTCPCGETFTRPEGVSSKSWGRMKYCDKHRAMNPHTRQKDIERILAGKGEASTPAAPPAPKASPAPGNDPVPDPALEGITWKRCAFEKCGEIFYRPEGMSEGAWSTKKYHCDDCKRQARNARARAKTQRIAKNTACIPDTAQTVADEKWEELAQLLSPFVGDIKTLDSMKAACMKIGAECYTQCARDMGVAV